MSNFDNVNRNMNQHYGLFCPHCGYKVNLTINLGLQLDGFTSTHERDSGCILLYNHLVLPTNEALSAWCPECGHELATCDPPILDILVKLNKLGYHTKYSCAGHTEWLVNSFNSSENAEDCNMITDADLYLSHPYIAFDNMDQYDELHDAFNRVYEEYEAMNWTDILKKKYDVDYSFYKWGMSMDPKPAGDETDVTPGLYAIRHALWFDYDNFDQDEIGLDFEARERLAKAPSLIFVQFMERVIKLLEEK